MNFVKRRTRNSLVLIISIVIVNWVFDIIELSLNVQQYYSGWVMAIVILFLLAFYLKKKLSIIPLGNNSTWAQWHYYSGFFLIAVFLKHIEFSIPNGNLEVGITVLFVLVIVVGILGLLINRIFARRLSYLGEEIIFERITGIRNTLKNKVEERLLASVKVSKSKTLADYYLANLSYYFSDHRHNLGHIIGSNFAYLRLVNNLQLQMRYLNETESVFALELEKYIEQNNTLDTHFALQRILKYWGLLHGPIAFVLSLLIILHVVLVYAFRGAA